MVFLPRLLKRQKLFKIHLAFVLKEGERAAFRSEHVHLNNQLVFFVGTAFIFLCTVRLSNTTLHTRPSRRDTLHCNASAAFRYEIQRQLPSLVCQGYESDEHFEQNWAQGVIAIFGNFPQNELPA